MQNLPKQDKIVQELSRIVAGFDPEHLALRKKIDGTMGNARKHKEIWLREKRPGSGWTDLGKEVTAVKSLTLLSVLVMGLFIFAYEPARAMDYRRFGETREGILFYDLESLSYPSKDTVNVWIKEIFTPIGIRKTSRGLGKNYEHLDHSVLQEELNCRDRVFRQLSLTLYDKDGIILSSSQNEAAAFQPIQTDSINSDLYKAVCEQKKEK